jgi:D-alanyl-D-alanine dipeptidase
MGRLSFLYLTWMCLFSHWRPAVAQAIPVNKYGLKVVNTIALYREQVKADSNQRLVNVTSYIPGISTDIRYATRNNFTKQVLYRHPLVVLRLPAVKALKAVQDDLRKRGYGLKIFDCYRPYRITEKMWEIVPDDRYAADPKKGSGHNRAEAVDLTIIELKTGEEIPMPTGYDDFTENAHYSSIPAEPKARVNRAFLREIMEKHGFVALETEWWHFYLPDYEKYPLMDLTFEQIAISF